MGRVTARAPARRLDLSDPAAPVVVDRPDTLAVEEPLELRVDGVPLTVTMRTPGDDFDLALGFLLTEGVVEDAAQVRAMMHCLDEGADGRPTFNVVDLAVGAKPVVPRAFSTTSACGVCGTASIDAVRSRCRQDVSADQVQVEAGVLLAMPERVSSAQRVFGRTGGVHAAALFTAAGELLCLREDIGRHNALDKVIGWAARAGRLPLTGQVVVMSSRASFELVQKAAVAGAPVLAAVSAASSLAVQTADELGLTLVGFLRPPRLTVYTHPRRLA
ncbi:MAG TPA: formate dehydrogenase accessory sulfurtransferase FdhD [Dermatophilaceae bacterium]|nr:formate dehydrogenase accessory sulfurtransferase FdhD [Dermatophilaceae bacterium]